MLKTTAVHSAVQGRSRYPQPSDCDTPISIQLLDGPDAWRGTAAAGSAGGVTLASTLDESSDTLVGKFALFTNGTGSNQFFQIVGWGNSSKVATPDANFTASADTTTTYLIADSHRLLYEESKRYDWDYRVNPGVQSTPTRAAMVAETLWLDYPPNKTYGLLWTYFADLDRLDESGVLFIKLLREWRSVWVQGVAFYTMQRYEDERFNVEAAFASAQTEGIAVEASACGQARFYDV